MAAWSRKTWDRRKFTTKITHFLSFQSIQNHFPGLYAPYKKPSANSLRRPTPVHEWNDTPCRNVSGLSGRGLMTEYGQNGDNTQYSIIMARSWDVIQDSEWDSTKFF